MTDDTQTPTEAPTEEPAPTDGDSKQPESKEKRRPAEKRVVIRYGRMANLGVLRHYLDAPPPPGTQLVVRTARGTELGQVLVNIGQGPRKSHIPTEALACYLKRNGSDYPIYRGGRVLRKANAQDVNDQEHLQRSSAEKVALCKEVIHELKLDMKLVSVEHLLGGERIVFYFAAEHRVDFRELVRALAGRYHTRIEMRQVGARDEARLVADFERCGMQCCCQTFLKFLKPVSMRMAKTQKATLDPTKISGRCGRLMCCLRYEDATYEQLAKKLPRRSTWVRTADGTVGKVMDTQTMTQLVRLLLVDRSQTVVKVNEIAERNVPEPSGPPPAAAPRPRPERQLKSAEIDKAMADVAVPQGERATTGADADKDKPPRKRRRSRRRKSAGAEAGAAPDQPRAPEQASSPQGGQGAEGKDKPAKKRRRRRRRRKPGSSGGGGAPPTKS